MNNYFNYNYGENLNNNYNTMGLNQNNDNPSSESSQKKPDVCMNCIKLMQENSQLKEQIAILQGEGKRKQYTIAPTLYTFYKNNVQKNRISR